MDRERLLIKNGYLVDPASGREGYYDLLAEGGKIKYILERKEEDFSQLPGSSNQAAEKLRNPEEKDTSCQVIDAQGLVIAPGLVDVHVHFREPGFTHKEDIDTGARAAAKGGFTTVVLMANTKPQVDNEETLKYVLERGAQTPIRVHTCANVTIGMQGKELTPMEDLAAQGAAGFTDDGIPLLEEGIVREAMERCAALGLPVSFHEEDPRLIENNGIHRGKASAHYGIGGSPREAEIVLVERDLELALETGVCINIQHISTKEAVELVRQAKKKEAAKNNVSGKEAAQGSRIYAEATPHHFTLTEEAAIEYGTLAKMNPPLREEEDRLAIIRGLQDGTIEIIATDHAPHTAEEKAKPITEAPSGITGLETALALGITELVDKKYLTLKELLQKMSTNPARMYGLDAGYLAEGGPADLILFDPGEEITVGNYASRATNTPFTGWKLKGALKMTVCRGKVVYEDRERKIP